MAETVVLKVGMSCQGCVGAVKRVLTKMEGVESFDVNIDEQKVTVKGNVTPDAVLQTVSKTGKKTSFWEAEPETKEAPAAPAAAPTEEAPAAAAAAAEEKSAAETPAAAAAAAEEKSAAETPAAATAAA